VFDMTAIDATKVTADSGAGQKRSIADVLPSATFCC
jgi:hypothetical protein